MFNQPDGYKLAPSVVSGLGAFVVSGREVLDRIKINNVRDWREI